MSEVAPAFGASRVACTSNAAAWCRALRERGGQSVDGRARGKRGVADRTKRATPRALESHVLDGRGPVVGAGQGRRTLRRACQHPPGGASNNGARARNDRAPTRAAGTGRTGPAQRRRRRNRHWRRGQGPRLARECRRTGQRQPDRRIMCRRGGEFIAPATAIVFVLGIVLVGIVLPLAAARAGAGPQNELDGARTRLRHVLDDAARVGDEYVALGASATLYRRVESAEIAFDRAARRVARRAGLFSATNVLIVGAHDRRHRRQHAKCPGAPPIAVSLLAVPALLALSSLELVGASSASLLSIQKWREALRRLDAVGREAVAGTRPGRPGCARGVRHDAGETSVCGATSRAGSRRTVDAWEKGRSSRFTGPVDRAKRRWPISSRALSTSRWRRDSRRRRLVTHRNTGAVARRLRRR